MRIAYLGPVGTYCEEAARTHYGNAPVYLPFTTIDETIEAAEKNMADVAVVPIENSTEGSVNRTLDILLETPLHICGEVSMSIHHQLLGSATELTDIREVRAHPQSLAQCRRWLDGHLPNAQRVAAPSNAQAAAAVVQDASLAAIAGERAAELYALNVLAKDIEDVAGNSTRFVVLGHCDAEPTGNDRTALVCSVPNKPGSLYDLLGIFARHNVNMAKLESRPAGNAAWEYNFFIVIEGHRSDKAIAAALKEVAERATFVKIIGSYPRVGG
ncbi:MAG TPA: prephenate dehydratase [Candidatus Saccharimonadales bacterium]